MAETVKYTVKKGDTLSEIAAANGTTVAKLVELNNIDNPDYIVVGQVLIISGEAVKKTSNMKSSPKIKAFGLQSNSDRTIYAVWSFDRSGVKDYRAVWTYATGDGVEFNGSDTTSTSKQSIYNAPANAKKVFFKVFPNPGTTKVNGKDVKIFTGIWSEKKTYYIQEAPPAAPSAPSVEIDKDLQLKASLSNIASGVDIIKFEVVKNDATTVKTAKVTVKKQAASYSCKVASGGRYKVRCCAIKDDISSGWSSYSDNKETVPLAPSGITQCYAASETSIYIEWGSAENVTGYDIEYTDNKTYFDNADSSIKSASVDKDRVKYTATDVDTGKEWFFRVRAKNSQGESGWTEIKSIVLGKDSIAPTTWSSTSAAVVGEPVTLYWIHNCEDGSAQTSAELDIYVNDVKLITKTISDSTASYSLDTTTYAEGAEIKWRVHTAGATKFFGDWSVQRAINVYAKPTLELRATTYEGASLDTSSTYHKVVKVSSVYMDTGEIISIPDGEVTERVAGAKTESSGLPVYMWGTTYYCTLGSKLKSFPFYISAEAGPNTQTPVGYHISITANSAYETTDYKGNAKIVNAGEEVYSKHFDVSTNPLRIELSAGNVDLENNITYTITCTVSMNSGLIAEESREFTVTWMDEQYEPNAEIGIDTDIFSAYIRPYCIDESGDLVDDITLSVYRREFDGGYTELATNLANTEHTYITDPHPSLDYARYRIVAMSNTTGAVSYVDLPGYPVNGKAVIIQWDEKWSSFEAPSGDTLTEQPWTGSMLMLSYNINVSDKRKPDVSLVDYIGRKHPVSYYGTHLGETSSWSLEIPKDDKETLYGLRRLSVWMGDVYVREPSGSGYWASIIVSFSQEHCELTIPVTIAVTRVEGGV